MKQLISLRINERLLNQIDEECAAHNEKSKYTFSDGTHVYFNGRKSRADVIEEALKEYFEKRKANSGQKK